MACREGSGRLLADGQAEKLCFVRDDSVVAAAEVEAFPGGCRLGKAHEGGQPAMTMAVCLQVVPA